MANFDVVDIPNRGNYREKHGELKRALLALPEGKGIAIPVPEGQHPQVFGNRIAQALRSDRVNSIGPVSVNIDRANNRVVVSRRKTNGAE